MTFLRTPRVPASLRQSPLGERLPKAELRQLSRMGTIIDVAEGKQIITESTPGRECFVVVDGQFAVSKGQTELDVSVGAGEVAGELALLTGRPRNATVVASADSVVYALHPREFATLLTSAHQLRAGVMTSALKRLNHDEITLPAQFVTMEKTKQAD